MQTALNSEIQNRTDAITAEKNARIASDTALTNSLNAEIQNRQDGDNALLEALNEEIAARIASDTATLNTAKGYSDSNLDTAKTYADTKASSTLTSAKTYADTKSTAALNSAKSYSDDNLDTAKGYSDDNLATAKSYADTKASSTLTSAKSYADTKSSSTLTSAKTYADTKSTAALNSAKSYCDEKIEEAGGDATDWQSQIDSSLATAKSYSDSNLAAAKSYADTKDTSTLNTAKGYSDSNLATAKTYADTKDTSTLNTAKSYSDDNLAAAKTYCDEKIAEGGAGGDTTDWQSQIDSSLAAAKSYADTKDTATLNSAKSYADTKDTATLNSAKTYSDSKLATETTARTDADTALQTSLSGEITNRQSAVSTLRSDLTDMLDNKTTTTLNSANTYTNGKISTEETARIAKDDELETKINEGFANVSLQISNLLDTLNERINTAVAAAIKTATDYTDDKTDEIIDSLPSDTQVEPTTTTLIKLTPPTLEVAEPTPYLSSNQNSIIWKFTISGYDSNTMTITYPAMIFAKTSSGFKMEHCSTSGSYNTGIDDYFDDNHNGLPVALKDTSKYCWDDGTSSVKTASATPAPFTFTFDTPVQDISKTYSGAQNWWKACNSIKGYSLSAVKCIFSSVTDTENKSYTDAGTYNVVMTPQKWCLWKDGGKDTRNFTLTIAQADWSYTVTDESGKSYTVSTADTNPVTNSDTYEYYPKKLEWAFTVSSTCNADFSAKTNKLFPSVHTDGNTVSVNLNNGYNTTVWDMVTITFSTPTNGNYKPAPAPFNIMMKGYAMLQSMSWDLISEMLTDGTFRDKIGFGQYKTIDLNATLEFGYNGDNTNERYGSVDLTKVMISYVGTQDDKNLFTIENATSGGAATRILLPIPSDTAADDIYKYNMDLLPGGACYSRLATLIKRAAPELDALMKQWTAVYYNQSRTGYIMPPNDHMMADADECLEVFKVSSTRRFAVLNSDTNKDQTALLVPNKTTSSCISGESTIALSRINGDGATFVFADKSIQTTLFRYLPIIAI